VKRIVLALALVAVVSMGAFAYRPGGWGVGGGFQFGHNWDDHISTRYRANSSLTLFLKAPTVPIYWGLSASVFDWRFGSDETRFGFRVTGDYHLIDSVIFPDIGLGWFLGLGGYLSYDRRSWGGNSYFNLVDLGVRVPIGISWIPLDFLEVFGSIAPSLGFYWHNRGWTSDRTGIGGGLQGDLGVRFWF